MQKLSFLKHPILVVNEEPKNIKFKLIYVSEETIARKITIQKWASEMEHSEFECGWKHFLDQ